MQGIPMGTSSNSSSTRELAPLKLWQKILDTTGILDSDCTKAASPSRAA